MISMRAIRRPGRADGGWNRRKGTVRGLSAALSAFLALMAPGSAATLTAIWNTDTNGVIADNWGA